MRVERTLLENLAETVFNIGYEGEKNHVQVVISCPVMFRDHPDAVASMVVRPPQGDLYPVSLTRSGNDLIWDVSEGDVANSGSGTLQLTFTDGEGEEAEIIKTVYGSYSVNASLVANGEAPDPVQSWLDEAGAALATFETEIGEIRKITTATDADEGKALSPKTVVNGKVTEWEYIDLADPEVVTQAVDDWLDDHPEATTTVQDGAITEAKLNDSLKADLAWQDDVDELKSAFDEFHDDVFTDTDGTLVDYSSNVGTGAAATTRRWFVNGVVPAFSKINTIKLFCASATSGTVTIEIWERIGNTLARSFSKTVTPTASTINEIELDHYCENNSMISFLASASNFRMDSLATGKSVLALSDLVGTVALVSSLDTYDNYQICATIKYTVQKRKSDKKLNVKHCGNMPSSTQSTNATKNVRYLFKRYFKPGTFIGNVTVFSRSSSASGTLKVELWEIGESNLTLKATKTGTIGTSVGKITIPVGTYCDKNTAISVSYLPSGSNDWAFARYENENVGVGMWYIADIVSETLPIPSDSYGNGTTDFKLSYFMPCAEVEFAEERINPIVTVGAKGCDFTTIQDAINYTDENDTIIVTSGVYTEAVKCFGSVRIIRGVSRDKCILINHLGDYQNPPIEFNVGCLADMTIISDATNVTVGSDRANLAYTIHCDSDINSYGNNVRFENLKLQNANRPCIGMGLHQNYEVSINNCDMASGDHVAGDSRGTLYFHTRNLSEVTNQSIKVKNCVLYSTDDIALTIMPLQGGSGYAEFIGNTLYSEENGITNIVWDGTDYDVFTQNFVLRPTSNGNNVSILNT